MTVPSPAGRGKKIIFKFAAMLLSTAVVLCTLEVGLRIYYALRENPRARNTILKARTESIWTKSDDPELIYVHRADYLKDGVRQTESHGILRPDDVPLEKQANLYRIALVGDSIAAAIYLDYPDRFGTKLETLLNQAGGREGKPVQVVNFAVNGYGTTQEARLTETRVQQFNPDLVILQYSMNDPGNSKTPTIWFIDIPPPRSYLLDFAMQAIGHDTPKDARLANAVPEFGPDYGTSDYWFKLYDPASKSWRSVVEGFGRIDAVRRSHKIPVLIMIVPFLIDGQQQHEAAAPLHQRVRAAAESHGWDVLDLMDLYERNTLSELRQTPTDIYHPNLKGQDLTAQAIFEKLTASH
jgi:GDSL-like Lipase/Acylhydrolase family